MPVFNEAEGLKKAVTEVSDYLRGRGFDYEILLVDDASTDASYEIARTLAAENSRIRVHHHEVNQGPCSALRTGPALALKDWILLLPVDLAIPLNEIDLLWQRRNEAEIVLGVIRKDADTRAWQRKLQSWVYARLVHLIFGLNFKQVNYVALYRADVLKPLRLTTSGVALHAEILIRAHREGKNILSVGLGYQERTSGQATGSRPSVIFKTIRELMKI